MFIYIFLITKIFCQCDIVFNQGIISEGKILIQPNTMPNLVIDMNDDYKQKKSFMQFSGPSYSKGASTRVDGNPIIFENIEYSENFTIQFNIFISLKEDSLKKSEDCIILHKGEYVQDYSFEPNGYPLLSYNKKTRKLKMTRNTTAFSSLVENKWNQITFQVNNNTSTLFINGLQDQTADIIHYHDKYTLYIGEVPWRKCNLNTLIDDFKLFNTTLTENEIRSQIKYNEIKISMGCVNCQQKDIYCKSGFHLCKPIEMHGGAFKTARNAGWINWETPLWMLKNKTSQQDNKFRFIGVDDDDDELQIQKQKEQFQVIQNKIYNELFNDKKRKKNENNKLNSKVEQKNLKKEINQDFLKKEINQDILKIENDIFDNTTQDNITLNNNDIKHINVINKFDNDDKQTENQKIYNDQNKISNQNVDLDQKDFKDNQNNQKDKQDQQNNKTNKQNKNLNKDQYNFNTIYDQQNIEIRKRSESEQFGDNDNDDNKSSFFNKDKKKEKSNINTNDLIYFKNEQGNSKFIEKRLERYNATAICCPDY